MRLLTWLFRFAVFLVLMGFALSNTDTATLRFFGIPEFEWRAPLVLFLLLFFAAGALVGVIATMPLVLRQRRSIGRLRRDADVAAKTAARTDAIVPVDAARGDPGPRAL